MRRVAMLLLFLTAQLALMPALTPASMSAMAQPQGQRPAIPLPTPPGGAQQGGGQQGGGQQGGTQQDRSVIVINRANVAVTTLYVSSTEEDNWGTNRLTGQPLAAGRSLPVRLGLTRNCRFDLQVTYADGKIEERRDQDVCRNRIVMFDGSKAAMPVDRTERKIIILNRSPRTIKQVFLSPKTATNWGDDALGGTIASGEESELTYRGDCIVDVRIVFDNASAEERREADLCDRRSILIAPGWTTADEIPTTESDLPRAAGTPAAAGGTGEEVLVVNITGKTIEELYVFPDGAADEGRDRLGNDTLEDASNVRIRLDRRGACNFSVHGVFSDAPGQLRMTGVDLCAGREIRLDGAGVVSPGGSGSAATATRPGAVAPVGAPSAGITRLRNAGPAPVVAVFADPAGTPRSDDRLGDRQLGAGETFDLALPVAGQCKYHLVVIYRDGRNTEADVDLCATRELALP
jgi:hypothetical protein